MHDAGMKLAGMGMGPTREPKLVTKRHELRNAWQSVTLHASFTVHRSGEWWQATYFPSHPVRLDKFRLLTPRGDGREKGGVREQGDVVRREDLQKLPQPLPPTP